MHAPKVAARAETRAEGEGEMREHMSPEMGFDVDRYRKLLADAVDEKKRLALIDLLIEERAKERLEEQLTADRVASLRGTPASASRSAAVPTAAAHAPCRGWR